MHVQSILWYVRLIIFVTYEFLAPKPLIDLFKEKKSSARKDFEILDDGSKPELDSVLL